MTRIQEIREIVERHQAKEIDGVLVDAFSASAYIQVHDNLEEVNQTKLNEFGIARAMVIVWQVIEKVQSY